MANTEAVFLSALLRSGDGAALSRHRISKELFNGSADAYLWVLKYHTKYGRLPDRLAFQRRWPSVSFYKSADVDAAAEDLKIEYARRTMTNLLDDAVESMVQGDVAGAIEKIAKTTLRVQTTMMDNPEDFDPIAEYDRIMDEVMNRVERVKDTGYAGIPTGYPTLDHLTGGLGAGWFTVVSARLGQGKTWTMVKMACEAALRGMTALYYTLEQSDLQITMRTHSILSKRLGRTVFNNMDLQRGTGFDLREYKKFLESLESALPGRLIIPSSKRERVSPMTVASGIERNEPDIVFVDYITLMAMIGDGGWQSVAGLSAALQQLSQHYEIPIVVGSQYNRSNEIARSDNIGWDVDLWLEVAQKSPSVILFTVKKFRHGTGGTKWYCEFRPGKGVFDEVSGDRARELIDQDSEVE